MSRLQGVRARVVIEAVQGDPSDRFYHMEASSTGACSLVAYNPDFGLPEAYGLTSFETQENFGGSSAHLDFGWGPLAAALQDLVKPNDLVTVEVAGENGDDGWSLIHFGLVSSIRETGQSSPNSYRSSLRIETEGLQKLFNHAIFNWQGALGLGDDRILNKEAFAAYNELVGQEGVTRSPSQVIQALVKIGVSNSIHALVHQRRIAPGDLFDYAPDWGDLYTSENYPSTSAILMQAWNGTLWSLVQSVSEPDLHELFWTIRRVKTTGEEKPMLVHRARPFPDGGGQGDRDWLSLKDRGEFHTFGKNGAPTSLGYMRHRTDNGRVNAFHWGLEGFSNPDTTAPMAKLVLGWWRDNRGIAKYGFAPRQVSIGILPQKKQSYLDLVGGILRRVAFQEAPLYLMSSESRGFGCFLPGVHPGQAMEDWSEGRPKPTTGYISSVSHAYRTSPNGIQISATLGLSRCIRGVTFEEYPKAAAALVDMEHVEIQATNHPLQTARDGAKGVAPSMAPSHVVASATGIRYADQIKAAAARQGIPSWFLAKLFQNESSFGTDPRANLENSATALGPMQITRVAFQDAVNLGYRTPNGRTATLEDRRDVATSLDMAAFLVANRYKAGVVAGGCPESSSTFWRYVADAYNRGTSAAVASGQATSWASTGLFGYGLGMNVDQTKAAFGGIG